MLVLLDENLPHRLRIGLDPHDVRTVAFLGWAGLRNGALLKAAEDAGFDVIITADQSIEYQQNVSARKIGFIVLSTNEKAAVLTNLPSILMALDQVQPGSLHFVDLD